jgi:membrane-associated protein
MDFFTDAWVLLKDLLTNTEATLDMLVTSYGLWTYAILFLIIFCETGLVVTPFLPGDSLLFLAGMIACRPANDLNIAVLILVLCAAAILGDALNYTIGRFFGRKLFSKPDSKIFKQSYLEKTHSFYEKYGGKTIVIARFVPIVRTFAPFVAGMGRMNYSRFGLYNIVGGVLWVAAFCLIGYAVGGFTFVQENIKLIVMAIIVASLLPGVIEFLRARRARRKLTIDNEECDN